MSRLWLGRTSLTSAITLSGLCCDTAVAYFRESRESIKNSLEITDCIIGGPGIVMLTDGFKLGKQRYHWNHAAEGVWIPCGFEEKEENKDFLFELPERNAQKITANIRKHFLA